MSALPGFTGGEDLFHRGLVLGGEVDGVRLVAWRNLWVLLRAVEGYVGFRLGEAAGLLAGVGLDLSYDLLPHQIFWVEVNFALGPLLAIETHHEPVELCLRP